MSGSRGPTPLRQYWHPVAYAADVGPGPHAATLLEEPLALWRDSRLAFREGFAPGTIHADTNASILYRTAAPYASNSDYCAGEQYYYVVTNVDAANPSSFGESFAWDPAAHPNGRYRVRVTATDQSGNFFSLSKQVRIAN